MDVFGPRAEESGGTGGAAGGRRGDAPESDGEAESLHWSDDDEGEEEEVARIDALQRATLPDQIAEFKALLQSLDFESTTDVSFPLAARAHLERLVDQYWDVCVKLEQETAAAGDRSREGSPSERPEVEVAEKLKQMIINHPQSRSSPLLLRWPLLAADVPRPTWTLADEVVAAMEKVRRSRGGTNDQTEVEKMQDLDNDGLTTDMALPAIINCQHALLGLLHDLSQGAKMKKASQGTVQQTRVAIVDWRDVIAHVSRRSDVPVHVAQQTQRRLEGIYGKVSSAAAPAAWMAHLGMGGVDRLMNIVKAEGFDAPAEVRKVVQSKQLLQSQDKNSHHPRDLDRSILLPSTRKRARYLQDVPAGRKKRDKGLKRRKKKARYVRSV